MNTSLRSLSITSALIAAVVAGCGGGGSGFHFPVDAGADATVMPAGCTNGTKDGNESDVDCGGSCAACGLGSRCGTPSDCLSNTCTNGFCVPGATGNCNDGMQNGFESDIDCGGETCPPCVNGRRCVAGADCQSGNCKAGVCAPGTNQCQDGFQNGSETDVDCGGGACPKCPDGFGCNFNSDCASGTCSNGTCGGGMAFTCADAIDCLNNCPDQTCANNCPNMITTANGKTRLNTIINCLFTQACPSTNMGPCDPMNPNEMALCGPCLQAAQMMGGQCYTALQNCLNDM